MNGNELVKYKNTLNRVQFRRFKRREFNIYFAIISRMRNKGSRHPTDLSFKEIEKLSGLNYTNHKKRFVRDLRRTYNRMQNIKLIQKGSHTYESFILFPTFKIDTKHKIVRVRVNNDLVNILNNLVNNFTRFSLRQFVILKSSYSKTLFRLLKMYRTTGFFYTNMKDFRNLMMIPKSYSTSQITQRVLKPAMIELTPIVKGLHVKKIKSANGKIVAYKFFFKREAPKRNDFSKGFNKEIESMKTNVELNNWLKPSYKKQAYQNISQIAQRHNKTENRHSKIKKEPMKAFNHTLSYASLAHLKWLYSLKNTKLIHLSEYQLRKLLKAIKVKEKLKNK